MKRQKKRWQFSTRTRKISLIVTAAFVGLFIVGNGVLWAVYRERTYPRTKVMGATIGSVNYANLAQKVSELRLLPTNIQITHGDQSADISFTNSGIQKDSERTAKSANSQRSWLPVLNILRSPELKAPISIDKNQFEKQAAETAKSLRKDAVNARITLNGTTVDIQPGTDGFELDQQALQQSIITALDNGKNSVTAPIQKTSPQVNADSLKNAQKTLEGQLKTSIILRYNGKTKQASGEEIAKLFAQSGETYAIAPGAVQAYVVQVGKEFAIRVKDAATVANNIQQAVTSQKPLDATLVMQTSAKTYAYCVAAKGVDASYLPAFRAKLQQTYSDSRGWSLDGLVEYKEVTSGCVFTAWLTAADLMPSFGAICDSTWSCRVGPNVVINFDRWQGASSSWNANGGTIDDYRHMVINHETGHWLGFGHASCGGAGLSAPVMQQQSIDLQGCKFNPWPTASELAALRRTLGL